MFIVVTLNHTDVDVVQYFGMEDGSFHNSLGRDKVLYALNTGEANCLDQFDPRNTMRQNCGFFSILEKNT